MTDPTTARIKGTSVWFYIIAAFQAYAAYSAWSTGSSNPDLAVGAMVLAVVDVLIGVLFVVFGYFAAQRRSWAFAAGLVLYGLRAALEFFEFFSPITLIIRAFLMFRIFQGWQACVAANQGIALANKLASTPRSSAAPQSAPSTVSNPLQTKPAEAPKAWVPTRIFSSENSDAGR